MKNRAVKQSHLSVNWPALNDALPLYAKITIPALDDLWHCVQNGKSIKGLFKYESRAWVEAAFKDAMRAEKNASIWLNMNDEEFLNVNLEGLDDFSLITYSTITLDFSSENFQYDINEKGSEALLQVLKNKEGSVLVNYEWLYSDIVQYETSLEFDEMMNILKASLAHNIYYEKNDKVRDILNHIVSEYFNFDSAPEAANMVMRMMDCDPFNLEVYEDACIGFLNLRYYRAALIMFAAFKKGFNRLPTTDKRYWKESRGIMSMYTNAVRGGSVKDEHSIDDWEKDLQKRVDQFELSRNPISWDGLVNEFFPDIKNVMIKKIDGFSDLK